mmetsp:Transcript_4723/g.14782  ORF Transcript_4723/g.14782 Transcript_4723/m.14782 type:complete len:221 (+) Transcript_4723:217-879(+)
MDARGAKVVCLAGAAAVSALVAYHVGKYVQRRRSRNAGCTSLDIRPPFPPEIVALLTSSVLCYLSTLADGAPHLSLMNFTYCAEDEKIIMSTRRDTTKFRALLRNKRVAVLVHDFPAELRQRAATVTSRATGGADESYGQTYSVTLYGSVNVEEGAAAERYRAMHLARNGPDQKQFIVGDGIAIITILVDQARICNQQDKVHFWEARPVVRSTSDVSLSS